MDKLCDPRWLYDERLLFKTYSKIGSNSGLIGSLSSSNRVKEGAVTCEFVNRGDGNVGLIIRIYILLGETGKRVAAKSH